MTRLLLVKTSSLGDVVHNLPVVNDILQHQPQAKIDWLVEDSFASIPQMHPAVSQVFTVATRRWRKNLFNNKTRQEIDTFKQQLAQQDYDRIIDTQGLLKSAWMTRYTHGHKVGFDYKTAREHLASFFYDETHAVSRMKHAVNRNRELAALALNYPVPSNAPDYGINPQPNNQINLPSPFVIGLHGTSKASKLWPTDHWIELANRIANEGLSLVLPWGNQAEEIRANQIAAQTDNSLVLPKCNIPTLAYIIKQSVVAIGVDTGLSHLATALDKPTVAIYTDTHPSRTGVLSGQTANAVNLGGVGQMPEVDSVIASALQLTK